MLDGPKAFGKQGSFFSTFVWGSPNIRPERELPGSISTILLYPHPLQLSHKNGAPSPPDRAECRFRAQHDWVCHGGEGAAGSRTSRQSLNSGVFSIPFLWTYSLVFSNGLVAIMRFNSSLLTPVLQRVAAFAAKAA